jgi:anti-sigma regulatory factor (Ser/Thr protein kinase)
MALHELCIEPRTAEISRLIDWVEEGCRADGVGTDLIFKMKLALEEAVMNVISHAFTGWPMPHKITVKLDISEGTIAAEIIDNGRPFDPTAAPGPNLSLPLDQRHPGGLGIHLMRSMTDRIRYQRSESNNILRMEKARS